MQVHHRARGVVSRRDATCNSSGIDSVWDPFEERRAWLRRQVSCLCFNLPCLSLLHCACLYVCLPCSYLCHIDSITTFALVQQAAMEPYAKPPATPPPKNPSTQGLPGTPPPKTKAAVVTSHSHPSFMSQVLDLPPPTSPPPPRSAILALDSYLVCKGVQMLKWCTLGGKSCTVH